MGICAAHDGTVYLTTLAPFTLHALRIPTVAGIVTEYRHNAHADVILSRLMQTDTLDGKGARVPLDLVSLYTDQVPKSDTSRKLAKEHGVRIAETVAGALTGNDGKLNVDGVLLIAEHGDYPESATGQFMYPKRRLFGEIVDVFRKSGRVVPVFSDKHLSDNWKDAKWLYDTAKEMKIPLMAGSSLPVLWRDPPIDVKRGAKLEEIVAVSYHRLDSYGFHALEMVQCLAERRAGGETGVKAVRCLVGEDVWKAGREGVYDKKLLDACLARLKHRPIPKGKRLEDLVREPVLFVIEYADGLRANILTLNGAVAEWSVAWKNAAGQTHSTLFETQEARPYHHFSLLLEGIEKMMHTGRPTWPVERTLLTTGLLDALLISKKHSSRRVETPYLKIKYQSNWNWSPPPPPPPGRPSQSQ
jgi:hypothetical protein